MPPQQRFNLLLTLILLGFQWTTAQTTYEHSALYDWGYYGAFPQMDYESFGAKSIRPNLIQTDERCDDGYIFVEPRGHFVDTPGPVMLDNNGNLVWMQTGWGQAMDVKVQQFEGRNYITFWHGSDNGTFGEGYYLMVSGETIALRKITNVSIDSLTNPTKSSRRLPQSATLQAIYTNFELLTKGPLS